MNTQCVYLLTYIWIVIGLCGAFALPMSIYEQKKYPRHIEAQGLYDANDKVTILTKSTFRDSVNNQEFASYVEFYNAFCGFCKRYAPIWKEFAADVNAWQGIVQVAAIDCSADENHELCREYEVMAYPTVRYFSPYFKSEPNSYGVASEGPDANTLRSALVTLLRNETKVADHWPKLEPLTETYNSRLFDGLPLSVDYIFLAYTNSSIATEVILDLHSLHRIVIRQIESFDVAHSYGLSNDGSRLCAINRNLDVIQLPLGTYNQTEMRKAVSARIVEFADKHGLPVAIDISTQRNNNGQPIAVPGQIPAVQPNMVNNDNGAKAVAEIVRHVKEMEPTVFQADLEQALRYTLFHEIPQFSEISGERLLALQRYINVIHRYSPLNQNVRKFLQDLQVYVMEANELRGDSFDQKLKELERKWSPLFSSQRWIGCQGSVPKLRGFTCGLWVLFHFLTVQAAESEISNDPLETLQAIHGYVKYFFGCSDCSQHFQTMATEKRIYSVPSKDDAVLWLWSAHNQVNERLKGDATEDPEFPKIEFPGVSSCTDCRRVPIAASSSNHSNDGMQWDKTEVLLYLKRIYAAQNVSRYGIEDETMLPKTVEALREKRLLENVFSDMDMRMGILLYLFCIGMMILAVKLFVRRGYRKKMYSHDFLGKV